MLKQIPKSDINYRPFKVYKTFNLNQTDVTASVAFNHTGSTDVLSPIELSEKALYHQLYTMYYRDPHNPFTSYGDILPISESYNTTNSQRYLSGSAYVLPIKQKMYGEGIKPGSVILNSNTTGDYSMDDSYGNLISDTNTFILISLNIENGTFTFLDSLGNQNTLSFTEINLNDSTISIVGQTNTFTQFSANIKDDIITFVGVIQGNPNISKRIVGNVIYSHGLIIVTNDILGTNLGYFDDYNLEYKSTNTIYENEILLVVGEDEFNVSTNPSSEVEITGSLFQSPLFADYMYSSSLDTTGSYLAPYITTIGLYDDNMDMVAVAKLANPVKSMPDLPVNFLVRFDT